MRTREIKILCPECHWKPRQSSRWSCTCGCAWNTFDTGGVCPRCGQAWEETQCPSCSAWSPHRMWYREYVESVDAITAEFSARLGLGL
jgi:predicted amidophosphoribosyltransferase